MYNDPALNPYLNGRTPTPPVASAVPGAGEAAR
jgi:hypothetical protein